MLVVAATVRSHDGVPFEKDVKLAPIGTGKVDHRRAVQFLKGADYKGYLSGEWSGWDP